MHYQLYTLNFQSDIAILGYEEFEGFENIDYHLKLVKTIERPSDGIANAVYKPWSIACPAFYYLDVEGICTFLVKAEGTIELYIYPESSQADAIPFFHDTILSVALIYKNIFTLKASAVKRKSSEEANLFCANNGGGKSTLVTALLHNNYHFIEDHRVLLQWEPEAGYFTIKNYHPKIELWTVVGNEFLQSNLAPEQAIEKLHPIRPGLLKHFYRIHSTVVNTPIKVSNCFLITLMNENEPTSFASVKGLLKAKSLLNHLHQHQLIKPLGKFREGFAFISKLIQQLDILSINRAENAPFTDFLHLIVREMSTDMSMVDPEVIDRLPVTEAKR